MSKETTSGEKPNNRGPRYRGLAKLRGLGEKKEICLQELTKGSSRVEAALVAGFTYHGLATTIMKLPEFRAEVEKAEAVGEGAREKAKALAKAARAEDRAEARRVTKEKLEDKLLLKGDKAVDNFDILLDGERVHEKTLLATSQDVLDRIGVGVERRGDVNVRDVNVVFVIGKGYRDLPKLIEGKGGNGDKG